MYELHLLGTDAWTRQEEYQDGSIRIGRDRSSEIVVSGDPEVSRHHASLSLEKEGWQLVDQGSANGTFVNGEPLEPDKGRVLEDHDRITLGPSGHTVFVFRVLAEDGNPRLLVQGDDSSVSIRPRSLLSPTDDLATLRRSRDRLFVLYEASRAVFARVEDLSGLLDRVKLEVVRTLKVDEMIVALKEPSADELIFDVVNRRNRFRATEIAGSKTIIGEVVSTGLPALREVGEGEEVLGTSTSLVRHQVRSLMCVPMTASDGVLGAIYVQNPDEGEEFTGEDYDFLSAFARHAAVAVREAFRRQASERTLAAIRRENVALRQGVDPIDPMSSVVGKSPAMEEVRRMVAAVKDLPSTVLIVGESGTGKELVAKALHYGGDRSDKPFVSVNVAAVPEGLLESELFGHERGAFTGASARKIGRFEQAAGGTLFLDEIGEVPASIQVKLLRALQERSFERVGGTRPIRVDVRFVFATNRDLEQAVRDGALREDFYYRVNVVRIPIPPLRDRREDIQPLVSRIVERLEARLGIDVEGLSPDAVELLENYDFPGNVRELENVLERAFIRLKIRGGRRIEPDDLPLDVSRRADTSGVLQAPGSYKDLKLVEREMVVEALKRCGGNKRRAAQELGVTPQTLYNKLAEFELRESK
jgi:transcriptional regulator with GAF, ATPase, and Fis domain